MFACQWSSRGKVSLRLAGQRAGRSDGTPERSASENTHTPNHESGCHPSDYHPVTMDTADVIWNLFNSTLAETTVASNHSSNPVIQIFKMYFTADTGPAPLSTLPYRLIMKTWSMSLQVYETSEFTELTKWLASDITTVSLFSTLIGRDRPCTTGSWSISSLIGVGVGISCRKEVTQNKHLKLRMLFVKN